MLLESTRRIVHRRKASNAIAQKAMQVTLMCILATGFNSGCALLVIQELLDSLGGWLKKAEPLRGHEVVTYHKTWIYFTRRFGLSVPIEVEEKPGIPPSARQRERVIAVMREREVRTILQAVFYDRDAAGYVAQETGARVVVVPIDVGAGTDATGYFELIDLILDRLLAAELQKD